VERPSQLETHAITSHAPTGARRPKSESRIEAEIARQILLAKLADEEASDLSERLEKCGEEDELTCTCCGERWTVFKRCNRKWCPVCQRALSTRASLRYTGICSTFEWPLFVTLTVKNYQNLDIDIVRHMRRSLGKLRRLRWWQKCVKGGVAGIEVTNTGKGWHPHLHMLLDCRWFGVTTTAPGRDWSTDKKAARFRAANRETTDQWSLCLGRKGGLKAKRAYKSETGKSKGIAAEIIKYSVKGSDLIKCDEPIAPILRMLDGTRLLTSFGSAYGKLRDWDTPKVPSACGQCGKSGYWVPTRTALRMMRFSG
jgi:hypothetical protein